MTMFSSTIHVFKTSRSKKPKDMSNHGLERYIKAQFPKWYHAVWHFCNNNSHVFVKAIINKSYIGFYTASATGFAFERQADFKSFLVKYQKGSN